MSIAAPSCLSSSERRFTSRVRHRRSAVMFVQGLMIHPLGLAPGADHAGTLLAPHDLWRAWNWEPAVWLGLMGSAVLYTYGVRRLWHGAGSGRGIPHWQATAFVAGWLGLFIALVSPIDALGSVLFSAHMGQHELMMVVAAPLLVLGRPLVGCLWSLPPAWRQRIGRWWGRSTRLQAAWHVLTEPLVAWALQAMALWGWHAPLFYQAALQSQIVHLLQHVSFMGSALLFWWALIYGRHGRMGYGIAVLYIFTTAVHSSVLGALLTFAPSPWYPAYLQTTAAWKLTPLEDQQLAGLIMWVPAGVIYTAAGLALFAAWLREAERRVRQRESQALLPDER